MRFNGFSFFPFLVFPFPALFTSLFSPRRRETGVRILPRRMPTDVEKTRPGISSFVFDRASIYPLSLLSSLPLSLFFSFVFPACSN